MPPPSRSSGSACWVRKNTPLNCTFSTSSNCASVVSANETPRPAPALLTFGSSPPYGTGPVYRTIHRPWFLSVR